MCVCVNTGQHWYGHRKISDKNGMTEMKEWTGNRKKFKKKESKSIAYDNLLSLLGWKPSETLSSNFKSRNSHEIDSSSND